MRITQAHVSKGIRFFENGFREKYALGPHNNPDAPAVFYGLYDQKDFDIFANHRGLAIALFAGSDAINPDKFLPLLKRENVRSVSTSWFIDGDLKSRYLPFFSFPVTPFEFVVNPVKKGPCIYIYLPPGKEDFYGLNTIQKAFEFNGNSISFHLSGVKHEFPVIVGHAGKYPRSLMRHIYSSCFLGLRLTPHDGLATTVVEMGMHGIPCVYNGGTPNGIPWPTDIPEALQQIVVHQAQFIGTQNIECAVEMDRFLRNDVPDVWLDTDFYL